jgi:hypothetical protein
MVQQPNIVGNDTSTKADDACMTTLELAVRKKVRIKTYPLDLSQTSLVKDDIAVVSEFSK